VRLAPFYDVASALPYDVPVQKLRLAMKFGSGYRLDPVGQPWRRLAAAVQLTEDEVRGRARELVDNASDAFASAADDESTRRLGSPLPGRLVDLVSQRARRCAGYLR